MRGLTEDQEMLVSAADRLALELGARGAEISDAALWSRLCDMGWPGVIVPEAYGGFGGSAVEVFLLGRAHGAGVPDSAFLGSAVLSATVLNQAPDGDLKRTLLPIIASGEIRCALALLERSAGLQPRDVVATAAAGGGSLINGEKVCVLGGHHAQGFIVSAAAGSVGSGAGRAELFYVAADASGLLRREHRLIDGRAATWLTLHNVAAPPEHRLAGAGAGEPLIRAARNMAFVALAGEALGALEAAYGWTLEHLRTRRQFGQPLANFQVLRHRVADMFMIIEEIRALGLAAASAVANDAPDADELAVSAKAHLGTAGVWVAEQAVQLHGAMGVTDEIGVGRCLKRLLTIDALFGNAERHFSQMATAPIEGGQAAE